MTDQTSTDLGVQGVPQDAMRRLAELQPGRPGSIFTSDLSVNEFLLVREAGFRPLGLVLASSRASYSAWVNCSSSTLRPMLPILAPNFWCAMW